jgi:hypothetical protein
VGNIYEMMGSEPVEMAGAPAGIEMAATQPAQELNSAADEEPAERPFSFVQTPIEAFISEKKPLRQDLKDGDPRDNRM